MISRWHYRATCIVIIPGADLTKSESPFLSSLQTALEAKIAKTLDGQDRRHTTVQKAITATTKKLIEELPEDFLRSLKRRAPRMLKERREMTRGFEERNFARWQPVLDLLEMMIVIAEEIGEAWDKETRPLARKNEDFQFEALSHLYPRAILVAKEILCLLKGGYPDAALSRWRSLHELTVTAIFLKTTNQQVAYRYLCNFHFQASRAADQYNKHAKKAKLKPFSSAELHKMKQICTALSQTIGGELKRDYDWATPALNNLPPTFESLEKRAEMDHWRPRYRWASQHIHGGHRPANRLLGLSESENLTMLVGPSNSGFVDPLQMTAISLMQMTVTILSRLGNFDSIIHAEILRQITDEIGRTATKVEVESLSAHKRELEQQINN